MFGLFMTSLSTEYYQVILAQGVCSGIGIGNLFLPAISVLAQHFHRRRALATGVAVIGSSIGGVTFPIMRVPSSPPLVLTLTVQKAQSPLNGVAGFADGVRASAYLVLGCLVLAQFLMSTRYSELGITAKAKPGIGRIFADRVFQLSTAGLFLILLGVFLGALALTRLIRDDIAQASSTYRSLPLPRASVKT